MDYISDSENLKLLLANAPGQPLIWSRFLDELVRQLQCDAGALLVTDLTDNGNTHFLFGAHIEQEYRERYENKLNKLDRFNRFISKNPHKVFYNQALKKIHVADYDNGFISPGNLHHYFGISTPCNHKHALCLIVYRTTPFNESEQADVTRILQSIMPSLKDAVHAEQGQKIKNQLRHYLDGHFDGFIIVDPELNIIFSDTVFKTVIKQLECLNISENRLCMNNPAIERQLQSSIEYKRCASIPNHCEGCSILLLPISSLTNLYQWECFQDAFIVVFTQARENNPVVDRLTEIYRLSPCEAVCALQFMKTPSIADIAAIIFRSQETVRNHIKHVMQKMDVHSQAELMKKLITLASL